MVNTLKFELQNLKQEVNKLMTKETTIIRQDDNKANLLRKGSSNSKDDSMQPSLATHKYNNPASYNNLESY